MTAITADHNDAGGTPDSILSLDRLDALTTPLALPAADRDRYTISAESLIELDSALCQALLATMEPAISTQKETQCGGSGVALIRLLYASALRSNLAVSRSNERRMTEMREEGLSSVDVSAFNTWLQAYTTLNDSSIGSKVRPDDVIQGDIQDMIHSLGEMFEIKFQSACDRYVREFSMTHTHDNLADFLTKPLDAVQFFALRDVIMNVPAAASTR